MTTRNAYFVPGSNAPGVWKSQTWDGTPSVNTPIGPNLIANGDDFAKASWTKTNVTLLNAGNPNQQINETATTGFHLVQTLIPKAAGVKNYRLIFDVKDAGSTWLKVSLFNQSFTGEVTVSVNAATRVLGNSHGYGGPTTSGTLSIQLLDNGWSRVIRDFTSDATTEIYAQFLTGEADDDGNTVGATTNGLQLTNIRLHEKL